MKKLKNKIKEIKQKIKQSFNGFKWYNWSIYLFFWLALISLVWSYGYVVLIVLVLGLVVFKLFTLFNNNKFIVKSQGNGIIFGNRGAGKGLLFQFKINTCKKAFCNVPYGDNTEIINIKEYIQSIGNNTILDTINNTVKVVPKIEKFEGVPVFWDDITVYAPNFLDNVLKKEYPSLPLTLAINRHLYNSYMVISVQAIDRPYKMIRELQTDFSIKALKNRGFGPIWSSIPFLRKYVCISYRYYEEQQTAKNGLLPFKGAGVINESLKPLYLGAGQATKESFEASNGVIFNSRVWLKKKAIYYDTRYFHTLFYGKKAPNNEKL